MALVLIILIFFGPMLAILALILALPWRIAWRVAVTLSAAIGLKWQLTPPVTGANHVMEVLFGNLIVTLALIAPALGLIVKLAISTQGGLWVRLKQLAIFPPRPAWLVWIDGVLGLFAGSSAAIIAMVQLSRLFQGAENTLVLHVGLALWAGLWTLLSIARFQGLHHLAGISFGVGLFTLTGLSLIAYPALVQSRAAQAANGDVHCITLPSRARAVTARHDLSFLTMDKGRLYYQHPKGPHAALHRLGQRTLYWSFFRIEFLPLHGRDLGDDLCDARPLPNPWVTARTTPPAEGGIPPAFHPQGGRWQHFFALAPDFGPSVKTTAAQVLLGPAAVELPALLSLPQPPTDAIPTRFGLIQQQHRTMQVYLQLTDGRVTTRIRCTKDRCTHTFLTQGRQVLFLHSPDLLPQWRDMQARLAALLESWRVPLP